MLIYVKVELACDNALTHSFVIPFKFMIDYNWHVGAGDTLVFGNRILLIRTVCHYGINTIPMTPAGEPLFLAEPLVFDNEHDLLLAFDEFKSNFELLHLGASSPPKQYYLLYRSLISIDIDESCRDDKLILHKMIAEILRAIFIAEFPDEEFDSRFTESSTYIEWLYQIMIESEDQFDLLNIVDQWESMINGDKSYDGSLKWVTDKSKILPIIQKVFVRSKALRDKFQYIS